MDKMKNSRKYIIWFLVSLAVFMLSVFLHECGHGIANSIAGIPCSTGFNRVGDIYKFPSADDFRSYYGTTEPVLLDFGVPCTLVLSLTGAVLYARSKNRKLQYLGASLACGNSLLRLVPCLMVLLVPLATGSAHIEDEYETGQLLVERLGSGIWLYVPAVFSVIAAVSSLTIVFVAALKRKISRPYVYVILAFLVFCTGMVLASVLDRYVRINWPGM